MPRIRDLQRQQNPRKRRRSDFGSPMKKRNDRRKTRETVVCGTLRYYTATEEQKQEILNMIDKVKLTMAEKISAVSNYQALEHVLKAYLDTDKQSENSTIESVTGDESDDVGQSFQNIPDYQYCTVNGTNEEMYLVTESALQALVTKVQKHDSACLQPLACQKMYRFAHAGKAELTCAAKHQVRWDTSPHVEGGNFLVNLRMTHAYLTSGLRKVQFDRFCHHAHLGSTADSAVQSVYERHLEVVQATADKSMNMALDEEEALSRWQAEDEGTEYRGIDIMTDCRHQWRKNAACSDVVTIGEKTKKCLLFETVTRQDDTCSQRHEMIGTKRTYEYLDEKGVPVDVHAHDRNESVNKYLKTEQPNVRNANDTWHLTKGINKEIKHICSGPKKNHGKTWHTQLSDKAASIKTHCYYAIKRCKGSADNIRASLDNIVYHYQDIHDNCHPESACRSEEDYSPSKILLTDEVARNMLTSAIKKLKIYKKTEDYVLCRDTHYVESFNNALLIYHDKRIVFSAMEYKRRTLLASLDWNEHIDREPTSISAWEDPRYIRRKTGKKNLPAKEYKFSDEIWEHFIAKFYSH